MDLSCTLSGQRFKVNTRDVIDLGINVQPTTVEPKKDGEVTEGRGRSSSCDDCCPCCCFGIPAATATPLTFGSWVGAVSHGASVNCPVLTACFHGCGTHTECCGHALAKPVRLHREVKIEQTLIPAVLLTVEPEPYSEAESKGGEGGYLAAKPEDKVVSRRIVEAALKKLEDSTAGFDYREVLRRAEGALIIRTLPNPLSKRSADHSGGNSPFLLPQLCSWLITLGIRHLLLDLPSADKEDDCGCLLAHRAFWELPQRCDCEGDKEKEAVTSISQRTITELCYCPDQAEDGLYLLDLQVSPIEMDAAPSRPRLYRLVKDKVEGGAS